MPTTARTRSRRRSAARCSRPSGAAALFSLICSSRVAARSSTSARWPPGASTRCRTPRPRAAAGRPPPRGRWSTPATGAVRALTAALAFEYAGQGVRVVSTAPGGTEAPERRVPRGPGAQTKEEKAWYQAIVDQTVESSLMKRYGTIEEQVAPILFLASDEASYITGVTLPVAGGDLG